MRSERSASILLLAGDPSGTANTVRDHIRSFPRYSRHRVRTLDPCRPTRGRDVDLEEFDVVVIHYTLFLPGNGAIPPWLREKLRAFGGLKVQFIQDEYRTVDQVTEAMRDVEIDVLFSAVPERAVEKLYGGRLNGTEIVSTLTGYVPEDLYGMTTSPLERRTVEVGYRGRVVPYWLGALGQEKSAIGRDFLARAGPYGLKCDIGWGELDRLYGERWKRFLTSCRATLATESGASITDFDGSIEQRTQAYLDEHPNTTFADVHTSVLAPFEGNVIINVVSPRVFEAAALRTAIVAFPGEYSGVIQPDEHYVTLEKDFSNFDEVVARIRDLPALAAMVERTHADIVRSRRYSYETFVHGFDEIVAERSNANTHGRRRSLRRVRLDRDVRARSALGLRSVDKKTVRRVLAATRLVAVDVELRRLLAAYLGDAQLRKRVRPRRFREDLLRLGAIRRAHRGQPVTATRFSIEPTLNAATGTLALISRDGTSRGARLSAKTIEDALKSGSVREIVWNHRAVSTNFQYVPVRGRRSLRVNVGYHGQVGVHEFGALSAIAARHPDIVWRALRHLMSPARPYRPAPLTSAAVRLLPRVLVKRVLRAARDRYRSPSPIRKRRSFHKRTKPVRKVLRKRSRPVRRLSKPVRRVLRKRSRQPVRVLRRSKRAFAVKLNVQGLARSRPRVTDVAKQEPLEQEPRISGRTAPRIERHARRVLVVYWWRDRSDMRLAVEQHLHALDNGFDKVVYVNACRAQPRWLRYELFDAVVLHPTFLCLRMRRKFERERRAWAWLGELDCPKLALPQDEYNHADVLDEWLTELGVDHVFSNFDEPTRQPLYPQLSQRARFSVALTGYIDEETAAYCRAHARPLDQRPLDVVYRAAHRRFWLGSHGLLKQEIGDAVLERAAAHGLDVDISTDQADTIWGRAWLDFLLSGRAIVGVESGSSVLDRRGEIRARIDELLSADPSLTFDQVDAAMPRGWDSYAFFAIGPRHLEAVVARTAQVLIEGTYNGVLEPERHYIPVKRDLSNLDDALDRLHDVDYLEELTSRAYEEIYVPGRWTIKEFSDQLREAFDTSRGPSPRRPVRSGLRSATVATLRGLEAVGGLHERRIGLQRRLSAALACLRHAALH
jgi:hypothetical protein